ncbi:cysteine-rich KTR domain-containing protein [Sporosarcina koreensis]|uniref:cysteine-rich KTR domain-containing protein n=1 Tax=Sporosarcina koreensis TaxID=334735 RepID=UPI0009EBC074|nr:cysteine-rich KTR domain-containing protein [Sporosarcina koreensis]
MSENTEWIYCPICNSKTRIKVHEKTIIINFPLYCPKCKQESLINIKHFKLTLIKEPDAKTRSR